MKINVSGRARRVVLVVEMVKAARSPRDLDCEWKIEVFVFFLLLYVPLCDVCVKGLNHVTVSALACQLVGLVQRRRGT